MKINELKEGEYTEAWVIIKRYTDEEYKKLYPVHNSFGLLKIE